MTFVLQKFTLALVEAAFYLSKSFACWIFFVACFPTFAVVVKLPPLTTSRLPTVSKPNSFTPFPMAKGLGFR